MTTTVVCTILLAAATADILPPAEQRFKGDTKEVPSFQRHVTPLMGRLGCNGRACHGSFQGQGGFRLSLFGYDFQADHDALLKGDNPRVNLKDVAQSKFLQKPTRQMPHKGGKLIQPGSWQHKMLVRWIEAGAPPYKDEDVNFAHLEVEPREILFEKAGQTRMLKVIAHWADGSQEDVTCLARFRSNDESIAVVDDSGLITSAGKGGTDIVAFYDNGVVPVQVLLPVSEQSGPKFPRVPTPTKIDELVVERLRKLGLVPSDLCTDVEFLRRVSLDMTGTLPTPEEVVAFLADKGADKRSRKIDELLSRPSYAAWWATRISEWTGNSEAAGPLGGERGLNGEKAKLWYKWIYQRLDTNVPYDKLVAGIMLATSRGTEQSYEDYCAESSAYFRKTNATDFAARPNMPYYWMRKTVGSNDGKALAVAHSFLGLSLQCAQCHKHPYDQWTKQDFDQFAAFFQGVSSREGPRDKVAKMKDAVGLVGDSDAGAYARTFVKLAEAGKLLPFKEIAVPPPSKKPRVVRPAGKGVAGRVITPKLLGGDEVVANTFPDPRQPIMDWMRDADNPYFARAFVNRIWAAYFNIGLIDPPDDLNLANPPSNPALLDYLAKEFIQRGFDIKWLHREISNSRTYQLSWRPNEINKFDERNYSHAIVRRLPAEVLFDALNMATASDESLKKYHQDPASLRAIGFSSGLSNKKGESYAVNLFGRPARAINCDCERSSEPSLLQTVYLRNDQEVLKMLDRYDSWLKQVSKNKTAKNEDLLRDAYLRTLSRLPDDRETEVALSYLRESPTTGLRDLLWALVNTKEFMVNR